MTKGSHILHNGATVPLAQWRSELQYTKPPDGFFLREAPLLAPDLIGCLLMRECTAGRLSGLIVETEAYTGDDPASHSFGGPTKRNRHMYTAGGSIYVYFVYGMHHCMNVVSGQEGDGQAVLIRAVEPMEGIEIMRINRPGRSDAELCSGPGRLCAALGVTMVHDGSVLGDSEFSILVPPDMTSMEVMASRRIGITRARARNWRFRQAGSGWVSS